MIKKSSIIPILVIIFLLVFLLPTFTKDNLKLAGESFTRTVPSIVAPNHQFSVIYTSTSSAPEYFISWRDTITGGCLPTYYENFMSKTSADSETQTKTITFTAPSSGNCIFNGNFKFAGQEEQPMPTKTIIICSSSQEVCDNIDNDCDGQIDEELIQTQSCGSNVGYCQYGTQTKTCSNGVWGSFGSCNGGRTSIVEICGNGIDEDCNGLDLVGNTLSDVNCDQCVGYSEVILFANKWIQKSASYDNLVDSATQWIKRDKTKC